MNELEMQQTQLIIALNNFNRDLYNLSDCQLSELVNSIERLKSQFTDIIMLINILHINAKGLV